VEALADAHQCVVYDLRGHGRSETPVSGYWPDVYATDLAALLDTLGIQRAVLAGNSVGGSAVARFALTSPERVAGLVFVAASLSRPNVPADAEMFRRMWEVTAARGIDAAMEEVWLPSEMFAGARRRPEVFRQARRMCLAYSGQGFRDAQRASVVDNLYSELIRAFPSLGVPSLLVHGELDYATVRATGEACGKDLPGCEYAPMQGVGHLANLEEPAKFNQTLARFLANLPAAHS